MLPAGCLVGPFAEGEKFQEPISHHEPLYIYIVSTRIDWGFSAEPQ
jgi:hypothetical protein